MKTDRKSVLAVIASAMLWGTYGSFVTAISRYGMSGNVLVFLRFIATCIPVLIWILIRDPSLLRVKKEDAWLFLANGIVSILFFTSCYTEAIRVTKIATAAALLYTSPAMVMLFSAVLFREKISGRKVICIAAAIIGCALVSGLAGGGIELSFRGLMLGLGSALGYALYSIFSRVIQNRGYSALTNMFYTFLTACLSYLLLSVIQGQIIQVVQMPAATILGNMRTADRNDGLLLIYCRAGAHGAVAGGSACYYRACYGCLYGSSSLSPDIVSRGNPGNCDGGGSCNCHEFARKRVTGKAE